MSDVPLTRAAANAADAALEQEFARLNPELHRRFAYLALELDAIRRQCGRMHEALTYIRNTAKWYADNDARLTHEVDHALCVEIYSTADEVLAEGKP